MSISVKAPVWEVVYSVVRHHTCPILLINRPFPVFSFERLKFWKSIPSPVLNKQAYHRILAMCPFVEQIVNSPPLVSSVGMWGGYITN